MSEAQIDCEAFAALVDHYFDERLVERNALDAHAAGCTNCQAVFGRMTDELSDLPCRTFVELVTEYLERSISAGERARMTRHLELCQGCRTYLDQIRTTIELTGALPPSSPDPALRAALVAAFRAIRGGPSSAS